MRRHARSLAVLVVLGALALPQPGCDRDDPGLPIVVVTPEPVRGIIAQTSFQGFQTDIWVAIEVLVSTRGKLDITVNWTHPDTWMFVYLGNTQCNFEQLSSGDCPFLIESETKDPKPRVLFTDLLDPGTYYLVLYNVPRDPRQGIGSDNTEAVAVQLGLTVGFRETRAQDAPPSLRLGRPVVIGPATR